MQPMDVAGTARGAARTYSLLGFGNDEDGVGRRVDNRRGSNADFRNQVGEFSGVSRGNCGHAGREESGFPQL